MKIKLRDGKQASEQAIEALESFLGCQLSRSFRDFLNAYDGARPEPNVFRIGANNSSGVNRFIPVTDIEKVIRSVGEVFRSYEAFPSHAYPVARDGCGNYVFIDESRNGAVFFWDHELPGQPTQVAPDFGVFLERLEPDTEIIEVKPDQVKKVWVDPEFLKRLNRKKPI